MLLIPGSRKGEMGLGCGRSSLDFPFIVSRLFPDVATAPSQGVDPFLLKVMNGHSLSLKETDFLFYTDSGF